MKPGDVPFGLDEDALRYIEARRLRIPLGAVGIYLDWPPDRVERVRKRVAYHRAHHRLSRELAFGRTQFQNRISMFFNDLYETSGVSEGRFSERASSAFRILSMEEFAKLVGAQEALSRLTADAQLARNTCDDLKAQAAAAERAVDEDAEDALINGREPNRDLAKQVLKIAAALKAAEQNVKNHRGAISKQERVCQAIQEKIYLHRHQAFDGAVSDDVRKLHHLINELVNVSLHVRATSRAFGFAGFDPFPSPDHDGSRAEIRSLQRGLYYAAQRLADTWARNYIDSPFNEPELQQFPVPQVPRALDPLQVKISAEVEILCNLTERYRLAYIDLTEAERSIDRIRQPYYKIGGGFAPLSPADDKEMSRLRAIVAAKEAEIKTIQMDRQKTIESIAKLEREYSEKRTAATAVGMQA